MIKVYFFLVCCFGILIQISAAQASCSKDLSNVGNGWKGWETEQKLYGTNIAHRRAELFAQNKLKPSNWVATPGTKVDIRRDTNSSQQVYWDAGTQSWRQVYRPR